MSLIGHEAVEQQLRARLAYSRPSPNPTHEPHPASTALAEARGSSDKLWKITICQPAGHEKRFFDTNPLSRELSNLQRSLPEF